MGFWFLCDVNFFIFEINDMPIITNDLIIRGFKRSINLNKYSIHIWWGLKSINHEIFK